MELGNGWVLLSIWGLVILTSRILSLAHKAVQAYRIRRGRMQMNEWLEKIGEGLDLNYVDGTLYSKDALKKWLAEMSVIYFKGVIKKNSE